ncbi:hypothetical protein [Haloquadratum walsbyi]|uniref:Uncharacterized protein n=1 Tax=Haloquadratum walsbyi J07HQW2 TaxID=1238425 RepID=U1PKS1_9EURY|nr:hypothetical protein [Haloquadratum walsbyi]ERG94292.1 MAG: hypothetical protein J07HQW2_00726 [Haloquadratum walsbyi J07HQW2]
MVDIDFVVVMICLITGFLLGGIASIMSIIGRSSNVMLLLNVAAGGLIIIGVAIALL